MKSAVRTSLVALSLAVITGATLAQPGAGGGAGGAAGGERRQDRQGQPAGPRGDRGPGEGRGGPGGPGFGSVEGGMKNMNRALRVLKDQVGDASKKEENLRLVTDMQRGCVTAKGAKFELPKDAKGKDEAAMAKQFRTTMIELLRTLISLEVNIMEGNTGAAKADLDKAVALRDKAHKDFGVKDDENDDAPRAPGRSRD